MADGPADHPAEAGDHRRTARSTRMEPADGTTLDQWLVVYLKGVAMGAADTVPGVSGGTIALITGIYERLVAAIASLDLALLGSVLAPSTPGGWRARRDALRGADVAFLVVLGLGILTAVIAVSGVVAVGLVTYRGPTNAFFFGLIAASAVVLYAEVRLDTPRRWAAALLAAAVAFWLTGATAGGGAPHTVPVVLLAGVVTSAAMLLPGISGAALLYVLGQYEFMIAALHGVVGGLAAVVTGGDAAPALADAAVVGTFLAGVAVGILTVAHAVRWALRRDRGTTLTVLVSLMVGALRLPVAEVRAATPAWTPGAAAAVGLAALVGAAVVLALDRYTDDLQYDV